MSEGDPQAKKKRPVLVNVLKAVAVLGLLVVAVLTLRGRLPGVGAVIDAIAQASAVWLVVAVLAEAASVAMFARQQRRLLTAFGVRMPRHRSLALAYTRSAIAISLPAGSALSAAYSFRQFRTEGASRTTAVTVMVLSGLLSVGALVLLYLGGLVAAAAVRIGSVWNSQSSSTRVSLILGFSLILLVGLFAWQSKWHIQPQFRRSSRPIADRWPRLGKLVSPVPRAITSLREVGGRHWTLALSASIGNWLMELLCLYASARAFHLPVSLAEIGAVYLTIQIVRQVPLTPGGIGVIEVSLLAGLLSSGATNADAAGTVLVYRLISCWLLIPVGFACWLVLRRPSHQQPVEEAPEVAGELDGGPLVAGEVAEERVLEHAVHQGVHEPGRYREP
jgi:putative heme transporter